MTVNYLSEWVRVTFLLSLLPLQALQCVVSRAGPCIGSPPAQDGAFAGWGLGVGVGTPTGAWIVEYVYGKALAHLQVRGLWTAGVRACAWAHRHARVWVAVNVGVSPSVGGLSSAPSLAAPAAFQQCPKFWHGHIKLTCTESNVALAMSYNNGVQAGH
eukprot:scaffold12544_cov20-Tisochrysis_lutea.AAC.1